MYAVGNLPDHVTRYNHKNPNRWLVQRIQVERRSPAGALTILAMALSVAGMIVTAAMVLQGVA